MEFKSIPRILRSASPTPARRYPVWIIVLMLSLALAGVNLAWFLPTQEQLTHNAYILHRTIGTLAIQQVGSLLLQKEETLRGAADIINRSQGDNNAIFSLLIPRLMKENPEFDAIAFLDQEGKEVFKTHRFLFIKPADLENRVSDPLYRTVREGRPYRGAVTVSRISEPLMLFGLPLEKESGFSALTVQVNLKFMGDVVSSIATKGEGTAYIVDEEGYIIAHPDPSLVLGRANVRSRKIVQEALEGREADTRRDEFTYKNEAGIDMFGVALPVETLGWAVVIENPRSTVFSEINRITNVAAISFAVEELLAILLLWSYLRVVGNATLFYNERNQRDAILGNLTDAVIEYDDALRVRLMNKKAEEFLGVRFSDVEDLVISSELSRTKPEMQALIEVMHPELAPRVIPQRALSDAAAVIIELHTSKPEHQFRVTTTEVKDNQGKLIGFLKILHDISREEVVERLKTEFISVAAHQLRTPTSAVKWSLRMLLDGELGELSDTQRVFLQKSYLSNERMISLINDLLNATRIEEGRYVFRTTPARIQDVIETVILAESEVVKSKNLSLEFVKSDEPLPEMLLDVDMIKLTVQNLLENAANYSLPKGKITVSLMKRDGGAEVTIEDKGVGIPEHQQERIFTKFFRGENVMRMETEGSGLGLFTAKNVIEAHGGKIWFESTEGVGTTFHFVLPFPKTQ